MDHITLRPKRWCGFLRTKPTTALPPKHMPHSHTYFIHLRLHTLENLLRDYMLTAYTHMPKIEHSGRTKVVLLSVLAIALQTYLST